MRLGALARAVGPLTYADPAAPVLERAFINLIEMMGGRAALVTLYEHSRAQWPLSGMSLWSSALCWLGVSLQMGGEAWPPPVRRDQRLVVIANHPYGLLDGIAICALAETLGRPFKILAHSQLMRVPELIPYFLPIDFNETEQAVRNNIDARRRAHEALQAGETIVIFPAGGVSTAPLKFPLRQFARANDLPWKNFAYRLIRSAEATVLPLYFVGQNGPIFHAASRVSMAWRIALLVGELNKRRGKPLQVEVGPRSCGRNWRRSRPRRSPCASCGGGSARWVSTNSGRKGRYH
ncbi:MAG TPA: 1-acyl-sn-glycerol-3-phosphate acyltransferase [Dongiaceae bacterium]|nr:1-acyl-sn-glycerol-3-phosphate acyltransferase [Dongiaceae bacterium]